MSLGDKGRDTIEGLMRSMLKEASFARPGGSFADAGYLVDANGMLWSSLNGRYGMFGRPNYAEISRDFGVNDEHMRLTLKGLREPSKAITDAMGYERVTFYRRRK